MSTKLRGTVSNYLRVLAQADAIDWRTGLTYYERLHEVLRQVAKHYRYDLPSTVAAFVSLSPNNDYFKNLRSLVSLMAHQRAGITDPMKITVSTYNACKLRAWNYLLGESFLKRSKGEKILAFYRCILFPNGIFEPQIVIDGHMVSAWCYKRYRMTEVAVAGFDYDAAVADVRCAASGHNIKPQQAQAIIWLTWKRINRILVPQTLDLWGDHWQIERTVHDLKPYPLQS